MTIAAYESGLSVRAYVFHAALGETLPDMPLFLQGNQTVSVPLDRTYEEAFASFPQRWKRVLQP